MLLTIKLPEISVVKKHKVLYIVAYMRILPTGNLLLSGKQRISLSTNLPVHVNEGKLVDKEILCLIPLNFPLVYHMQAENLEDKGKIPSCMSNEGNTRFTFPRRTNESEAIMVLSVNIYLAAWRRGKYNDSHRG